MRYLGIVLATVLIVAPDLRAHDNWCGYDFTELGVPSTQGSAVATPVDVNGRREIIASDGLASYLLSGGVFEDAIHVPGSTVTAARSINNRGEIVGNTTIRAVGGSFFRLAFYRDVQGQYTTFNVPGGMLTEARGVSNTGAIVGSYRDFGGRTRGFILKGGAFETIDAPFEVNTTLVSASRKIVVGTSVNNEGTRLQSFVLSDGIFTPIDIPAATPFTVLVRDVNERGEIIGSYADAATNPPGKLQSFVLTDDHVALVEAPFRNAQSTEVAGINNRGELVGRVHLVDGQVVGFTAAPRNCGGS